MVVILGIWKRKQLVKIDGKSKNSRVNLVIVLGIWKGNQLL